MANRILRDGMRATRKAAKSKAEADGVVLSKASLPLGNQLEFHTHFKSTVQKDGFSQH